MDLTNIKATAYTILLGLVGFVGAKLLGADWTLACTASLGILGGAVVKHYFHITLPSSTTTDTSAAVTSPVVPAPAVTDLPPTVVGSPQGVTIHAENVHIGGPVARSATGDEASSGTTVATAETATA